MEFGLDHPHRVGQSSTKRNGLAHDGCLDQNKTLLFKVTLQSWTRQTQLVEGDTIASLPALRMLKPMFVVLGGI